MKRFEKMMMVGLSVLWACGGGGGTPVVPSDPGPRDTGPTDRGDVLVDPGTPLDPGHEPEPGPTPDVFEAQPPDIPDIQDQGVAEEVTPVGCPGGVGCECSDPNDCFSGLCVETMEGFVCSNSCAGESDCPKGWVCVLVQGLGGDPIYACVDPGARLCRPCKENTDCRPTVGATAGATYLCMEFGPIGRFCGLPCAGNETCPDGFECKGISVGRITIDQCVPKSGNCPCTKKFITEGATTVCYVQNEFGQCFGERTCDTECNAKTPSAEECNGLDDDCNGVADDNIPAAPCPLTNGYGTCMGISKCLGGQITCEGSYAAPESCNGADDDCDGETDEGFPDTDNDKIADCIDDDRDGDDILNSSDNCPDFFNPDQLDNDKDGQGDACDNDDDNDGIPDVADNCPFISNTDQKDLDGDLIGDACDCDMDGDGVANMNPLCPVCNPCDNCPQIVNPGQGDIDKDSIGDDCDADMDGDLVPNANDNCPSNYNPDQHDLDMDNVGDECDPDDDNDGILDHLDNCPVTPNSNQVDTDGDGSGDACDCDKDGDGVFNPGVSKNGSPCPACDPCDNCELTPNPNQEDKNKNGIGDACEDDWDNDGILNANDNCPWVPNQDQADLDHDGVGDACDCDIDGDGFANPNPGCPQPQVPDNCPNVANPDQADLDKDGLGDVCDDDADGDGVKNDQDCAPFDPKVAPGRPEACNGVDDDCDGQTDENWPELNQPCDGPDSDLCQEGVYVCKPDGTGTQCTDTTGDSIEVCNTKDDDCDGQTDEDWPNLYEPCDGKDDDLCEEGIWDCKADGTGVYCTDDTDTNLELCNEVDDDCDGQTDEAFPMKGQACDGPDDDFCKEGVFVCSFDHQGLICTDLTNTNVELCNDVDDDCDGQTDEDFPTKGSACDGPDDDLCKEGVFVCGASGYDLVCTDTTSTNMELCNGKDDDCDGQTDEAFPNLNQPCDGPDDDLCKEGKWVCSAEGTSVVCDDNTDSNPEICNDVDDDCDGLTDETFPDKGKACDGPDPDSCAGGILVCNETHDGLICVGDDVPSPEVCNNKDDDCDGQIDEDWPNKGLPCDGNDGDLCMEGVWVCNAQGTGLVCSDNTGTNIEQCNGEDDDCDGLTDETWPELGTPCDGPDGDVCKEGIWVCNAIQSGVECTDTTGTNAEVCNAKDDDCDGSTDEGTGTELCGTPPHGTPVCSNGVCQVVCDTGWFDVNSNFSDGCECQQDTNDSQNNVCSQATDLGSANDAADGVKKTQIARILPGTDEDWYKFTYTDQGDSGTVTDPAHDKFHLRFRLEYPTDGSIRFEVYKNGCATGNKASCGAGQNPGNIYEHAVDFRGTCTGSGVAPCGEDPCYTSATGWRCKKVGGPAGGSDPEDVCCESGDPASEQCRTLRAVNKCADQTATYYIRVFRASGVPTSCSQTEYKLVIENI